MEAGKAEATKADTTLSYPVMVDLETLATKADAVIVQIGLVAFNPEVVGEIFKKTSILANINQPKRRIDPDTLKWWLKTNHELLARLVTDPSRDLSEALSKINSFCREVGANEIWANSPSFDIAILRDAYDKFSLSFPISFRGERDYRTFMAVTGTELSEVKEKCYELGHVGTVHNALDDAIFQAIGVQLAYQKIRKGISK